MCVSDVGTDEGLSVCNSVTCAQIIRRGSFWMNHFDSLAEA